ncbi:HPr family phosphocarrier protein [Microbacterium sp.]|jgi:phosphocarrier protein HPr|uniref:HPr family phosphocarrier protein n=1 Tax=Microbacterium sp. TaxID=51671 RepID=UPI0037CA5CF2
MVVGNVERVITVAAAAGLHARPAAEFVRLASAHPGTVEVRAAGRAPVDGASVLGLMTLDVHRGESIVVAVDGPDAEALLDRLEAILDPEG